MLQLVLNLLHCGGQLLHIHLQMLLACTSQQHSPSESSVVSCNVVCYNKRIAVQRGGKGAVKEEEGRGGRGGMLLLWALT